VKIKNLNSISIDKIVECFLLSFSDYFVKMPTEIYYYEKRWKAARVNYELSYGMFDNEKLVAFIINGIDSQNGELVAFNTGTGVLKEYRGQKIIHQIYTHAFPEFFKSGISMCRLEVITENHRAIKVYSDIGFKKTRTLKCFKGEIINSGNTSIKKITFENIKWDKIPNQDSYSWDNCKEALQAGRDNYKFYEAYESNELIGFFAINSEIGYLAQFEIINDTETNWTKLFWGIAQVSTNIKINNIEERLVTKISALKKFGLENYIDQFEMDMRIK